MPRRYKRRSSRSYKLVKPVKYSNETFSATTIFQWIVSNKYASTVIAGTDVLGTRKVKNFTLQLCLQNNPEAPQDILVPLIFALVFVPEGNEANIPRTGQTFADNTLTAISMYEPNQNVILQGIIDAKQIYKYKTRLGRNLNSGDTIQLVWTPLGTFAAQALLSFTVNYALAF